MAIWVWGMKCGFASCAKIRGRGIVRGRVGTVLVCVGTAVRVDTGMVGVVDQGVVGIVDFVEGFLTPTFDIWVGFQRSFAIGLFDVFRRSVGRNAKCFVRRPRHRRRWEVFSLDG